jgi:hypothetical protein
VVRALRKSTGGQGADREPIGWTGRFRAAADDPAHGVTSAPAGAAAGLVSVAGAELAPAVVVGVGVGVGVTDGSVTEGGADTDAEVDAAEEAVVRVALVEAEADVVPGPPPPLGVYPLGATNRVTGEPGWA